MLINCSEKNDVLLFIDTEGHASQVQAKFNAEQQRARLQQAAAGLSGQVHMLTGCCEDAEADVAALQHRLSLEAERVRPIQPQASV